MKLNRSRRDWADTNARAVLSGSFAQSQNVLIAALEDIATLHAEAERFAQALVFIKSGDCTNPERVARRALTGETP